MLKTLPGFRHFFALSVAFGLAMAALWPNAISTPPEPPLSGKTSLVQMIHGLVLAHDTDSKPRYAIGAVSGRDYGASAYMVRMLEKDQKTICLSNIGDGGCYQKAQSVIDMPLTYDLNAYFEVD